MISEQKLNEWLQVLYKELEVNAVDGVFTGSAVELYHGATIPKAYYSQLFYYLREMGCIEQVQRGARGRPSIIRVIKPPTADDVARQYVPSRYRRDINLTKGKSIATLQEQVDAIQRRLPDIDLITWITSVEARLKQLEEG